VNSALHTDMLAFLDEQRGFLAEWKLQQTKVAMLLSPTVRDPTLAQVESIHALQLGKIADLINRVSMDDG
jgi:hypothetical protein